MIGSQTFEEMRRAVPETVAFWLDEIVPEEIELLPSNRYSPRYAWMFSFERRLKYRIEKALGRPLGPVESHLFGADGVLSETLSNAFVHGNLRDALLPIRVTTVVGRDCVLIRVADQGAGFDVHSVLEGMERGSTYYHLAGNGLRALAQSEVVTVGFEAGGRVVVLYVPLDGSPATPPTAPGGSG